MKKTIVALLLLCSITLIISGCGNSASKPFIGVWYAYKVSTSSSEIVFEDYAAIAKMELITEFLSDGSYEIHYYVNSKESENYPKFGKYEMDGDKIVLIDDDGYGEIVDGELILYFDDGAVKQYFKTNQ